MKKLFIILIIAALACCIFAGCWDPSKEPSDDENNQDNPNSSQEKPDTNDNTEQKAQYMYITINGNKLKVILENNSSVDALLNILKQGDVVYTANDYGDFEKVGDLNLKQDLPENDSRITTQAGDVILYNRSSLVLFYGSNTWSYTKIGKIEGYSQTELKTLLAAGKGAVQVTISIK